MKYAVIITHKGIRDALIKTQFMDHAAIVGMLCEKHLASIWPEATVHVSCDPREIAEVGMHCDREWLMGKLREKEFPLPRKIIQIEGQVE